jgi:O-antigen/teichoic acid export membrane protein
MMLGLVLRLVEMLSDLGVERLLVQAPDGDRPRLQAGLQGALVLRGLVLATALVAFAPVLQAAFPDGPTAWTYVALAAVSAVRGWLHLDARRAERRFAYGRMAMVEIGAAAVMLAALPLAAVMLGASYTCLVLAMLCHAAAQVALSHAVAKRAYALRFDVSVLRRLWVFGAPLAANAALMFLTLQADRLIVAAAWTWQDLAVYGIAAQLAWLPAQVYGRASVSLHLPRFRLASRAALAAAMRQSALLGMIFAAGFAACAVPAIGLVYGAALHPDPALAGMLGLAAGLRILRTPLSVLALAETRTGDTARANLWRAAALLPGLALAFGGAGLAAFAATAVLGEFAAAIAAWRLCRNARGPVAPSAKGGAFA